MNKRRRGSSSLPPTDPRLLLALSCVRLRGSGHARKAHQAYVRGRLRQAGRQARRKELRKEEDYTLNKETGRREGEGAKEDGQKNR